MSHVVLAGAKLCHIVNNTHNISRVFSPELFESPCPVLHANRKNVIKKNLWDFRPKKKKWVIQNSNL